jgi:hypothetical protein
MYRLVLIHVGRLAQDFLGKPCASAHVEHLIMCIKKKETDYYIYKALVWFVVEFTQVNVPSELKSNANL